jgi:D-alanyl-D-alanine carboxypeptidase (penicillin-binding protein 5/6)
MITFFKIGIPLGLVITSLVAFKIGSNQKNIPEPVATSQTLGIIDAAKIAPPTVDQAIQVASLSALSFVVYDVASGQVVVSNNPDQRLMPASTTKMMTALVALDEYSPDEVITLSRATEAIGHAVDFKPDEQLIAIDIIKAMMINSGNDAAVALADHHPLGYQSFVMKMNQRATSLGLKNTHFSNVSGVEADDHYSTASDLAVIADALMENITLREIVGTKMTKVKTIDSKITHSLENLNQLLWDVSGVIGVKTGWTEMAGDCLVTYVSRDHDIITVVLKSSNRFEDSRKLIEWSYKNLTWQSTQLPL